VCFPDERLEEPLGSLWACGASLGAWHHATDDGPVAMVLTNTSASVKCWLGAIRAGLTVVSLPLPPRGMDLEWYGQFVVQACRQSGASRLLVNSELIPSLPTLAPIEPYGYENVLTKWQNGSDGKEGAFRLVQFTSGCSADPKGVVLEERQVVANILAMLERVSPESGDKSCSWLPISHDMGLIGMMMCSLVGGGQVNGARFVLLRPDTFLRRPATWLEACDHYGSTITAAPNFAFDMLRRHPPSRGLDLSSLRVCITGGEPVRGETLQLFSISLAPMGFSSLAFCPAYGLAEAGLAVSMTAPSEHWDAVEVDYGEFSTTSEISRHLRTTQVVSAGSPLAGYNVEVLGDRGVGELLVSGPSLLSHYADGSISLDERGRFHTSDLGIVKDGNVYVIGRLDDVFVTSGRKVYALDIEEAVASVAGVRAGRCLAFPGQDGELQVMAELERSFSIEAGAVAGVLREIRRCVNERMGLTPKSVHLLRPNALPMTSSGKARRGVAASLLEQGALQDSLVGRQPTG
jgi:acyl-CoA synthetase (AMP-forming)/AMP-acid ligase II